MERAAVSPTGQILDLLRLQGGRTKAGLARESNLSTSQVERITDQLVEQDRIAAHGILKEFYLIDDPFWRSVPRNRDTTANAVGAPTPRASLSASRTSAIRQVDGASYRASASTGTDELRGRGRDGMRKGLDFSGRAGRPEYWWFAPFAGLGTLIAQFLPLPLFVILALGLGIPQLAVATRRLHDSNRSDSWLVGLVGVPFALQMLGLYPISNAAFGTGLTLSLVGSLVGFVGGVATIVLLVLPGRPGRDQFGESPTGSRP